MLRDEINEELQNAILYSRYNDLLTSVSKDLTKRINEKNLYHKGLGVFDFSSGKQTEEAYSKYSSEMIVLREELINVMFSYGAFSFGSIIMDKDTSLFPLTYLSQSMDFVNSLYLGESVSGNLSAITKQCIYDTYKEPSSFKDSYKPSLYDIRIIKLCKLHRILVERLFDDKMLMVHDSMGIQNSLIAYTNENKSLLKTIQDDNDSFTKSLEKLISANESRLNNLFLSSSYDKETGKLSSEVNESIAFSFLGRLEIDLSKILKECK